MPGEPYNADDYQDSEPENPIIAGSVLLVVVGAVVTPFVLPLGVTLIGLGLSGGAVAASIKYFNNKKNHSSKEDKAYYSKTTNNTDIHKRLRKVSESLEEFRNAEDTMKANGPFVSPLVPSQPLECKYPDKLANAHLNEAAELAKEEDQKGRRMTLNS